MTDTLRAYLEAHRQGDAVRNAAAFRRIAAHLSKSGRADPSGNTAVTFLKCAERCDRIAQEK